jgi:putative transposase
VLDETHLWSAVRYVERNPVRAGMVDRAEDHPWSSARAHCGLGIDTLLSNEFPPPGVIDNWADWLHVEDNSDAVDRIRRQTSTGHPCGGSRSDPRSSDPFRAT